MFLSKPKNNKTLEDAKQIEQTLNRIGEGTRITGEIVSTGVIRLDGHLKGNLITKGKLVVGPSGTIIGDIKCQDADISGTIEGKIIVNDLLSLSATSKFTGNIITSRLSIEPGAIFTGTSDMSGKNNANINEESKTSKFKR